MLVQTLSLQTPTVNLKYETHSIGKPFNFFNLQKMSMKIHFSEIVYNFDKREQKKWIHTKNKLQNTEIADSRM